MQRVAFLPIVAIIGVCVRVCVCVCVCVCVFVCFCVFLCVCACACVCTCLCMCVCAPACLCVYVCVCVCIYVCPWAVCLCVCVYVCVCVCPYASMVNHRKTAWEKFAMFSPSCRPQRKSSNDVFCDVVAHVFDLVFESKKNRIETKCDIARIRPMRLSRKRWQIEQALPWPTHMKSLIGFRLVYIHLTMYHSKGQVVYISNICEYCEYFEYYEYLAKGDRYNKYCCHQCAGSRPELVSHGGRVTSACMCRMNCCWRWARPFGSVPFRPVRLRSRRAALVALPLLASGNVEANPGP